MSNKRKYFGIILDTENKILVLNSHLNIFPISKELSSYTEEEIHIVAGIWWSLESIKETFKLLYHILRNKLLFPNIKISILCNTKSEVNRLNFFGINAILCNHNCFIDENIFYIQKKSKKYDAVYNAVLSKFKRHYLCKEINKLALITYKFENVQLKQKLDKEFKKPIWLNYQGDKSFFLSSSDLCDAYNESAVGLALSKVEGAMYSSTEYLLCGIPVVSTKSKGGRDIFYNKNNSIIVSANAKKIKEAVDFFLKHGYDSLKIRGDTLLVIKEHRNNFFKHINEIYKNKGIVKDISAEWDKWFVNKLRNELYIEDIVNSFHLNRNND